MALTVLITGTDGYEHRFGADEKDATWVPFAIEWDSQLPGGWKSASFSLRRRVDQEIPLRVLDEVEIIDEYGQTMFEGRIQQLPRQHGDDFLLNVVCVGWAAHLLDDKSFSEVYVSSDLSRWQSATLRRRRSLTQDNFSVFDPTVTADPSGLDPSIQLSFGGTWVAPYIPICEAWYDAGAGNAIKYIYVVPEYSWVVTVFNTLPWTLALWTCDDDFASNFSTPSANLYPSQFPHLYVSDSPYRWGLVQWMDLETPAGTEGAEFPLWLKNVTVYGDHTLTAVGDAPPGYYIDDIIADALARAAPKLNFSTIRTSSEPSIEHPPYILHEAAYPERGSIDNVILDLNKYVVWDWVVYHKRTFHYRATDPNRLTWEARLERGIHLSLEGDDAEHAYNGCQVAYSLPDSTRRVAGPLGSGCDVESGLLGDDDPENTVTAHGYPRKWIELEISFPTDDLLAVVIGSSYLAQTALPARTGDITITGPVEHPTKGFRPAREMLASEWIRLSDHPADVPRRMISVRHNDDDGSTVVSVGNDINKVDAMLEQVGVITRTKLGS